MVRLVHATAALLLVISLVGLRRATDAVHHYAVTLEGGTPLVVYEPGEPPGWGQRPELTERLPVVVLAHGFAASTEIMSSLARRLTRSGYAVVTFDFRGHGRNPQRLGLVSGGRHPGLREDLSAVLLFARTQKHFDPERVVVAGHSMGGFAVVDYASYDPSVAAVIGISGAAPPSGPYSPPNALLIWASGDPARLQDLSRRTGAELAGLERLVLDESYGDVERGSAVRLSEVEGVDHITILYSSEAARRIVDWLRQTVGPGAPHAGSIRDLRLLWSLLGMVAAVVLFWPLVALLAPLTPRPEPVEVDPLRGLGLLCASMVAAVIVLGGSDLLSGRGPLGFMPILVASDLTAFFLLSGVVLMVVLGRREALRLEGLRELRSLAVAAVLVIAAYFAFGTLLQPFLGVWLAPHRVLWAIITTALTLPFFAGFELLLRSHGGRSPGSVWIPAAGRLLTIAVIMLGALFELLPGFVMIIIGPLLVWFLLFEIFSYRLSRVAPNPWVTGLFTAALSSWTTVAAFPFV
jgi:pimeloyl-ACP methyl ester carboxylesterase